MRVPPSPATPTTTPAASTTSTTSTTPATSTAALSTTTTTTAPEAADSWGLLATLRRSPLVQTIVGAATLAATTLPIVKPVLDGYSRAPERIATDSRTVTPLQARAEGALRFDLFARTDRIGADEVESLLKAAAGGRLTPAQLERLLRDVGSKRGFTGEAAALLTSTLHTEKAAVAAPLAEHRGRVQIAVVNGPFAAGVAKATDVDQGAVGDCYFAAAAAAIVQRDPNFPWRIMQERSTPAGDRYYEVTLSRNFLHLPQGQVTLKVEDSIWQKNGNPIYAQSTGAHWFQVLEQAGAQLAGDFDKLETGMGFGALARITGLSSTYTLITPATPQDEAFAMLKRADDAGRAMTTGAHAFPDADFVKKHGKQFSTLHEYAILDVTGTSAENAEITLYNPHGYTLKVSIDEFRRNFLGFSAVDLGQERVPFKVPISIGAPLPARREDTETANTEERPKRRM